MKATHVLAGLVILLAVAGLSFSLQVMNDMPGIPPLMIADDADEKGKLNKFTSEEEVASFLKANTGFIGYGFGGFDTPMARTMAADAESAPTGTGSPGKSPDYSPTNIQVKGVDEADIVKTDGNYIYAVASEVSSGRNVVAIVKAYPAESAELVSEIELDSVPSEIFVNNNRLVVFVSNSGYYAGIPEEGEAAVAGIGILPGNYVSETSILLYDISDRKQPELVKNITVTGDYFDSRMIGDYVYAIVNTQVWNYQNTPPDFPVIAENGESRAVPAQDIYYFDTPSYSYQYVNILGINVQDAAEDYNSMTVLAPATQSMYVSQNSIYLTHDIAFDYRTLYEQVLVPLLPEEVAEKLSKTDEMELPEWEELKYFSETIESYTESLDSEAAVELQRKAAASTYEKLPEILREQVRTAVHRISVKDGEISYVVKGFVPGTILNQFSMDEHEGYFRIATTTVDFENPEDPVFTTTVTDEEDLVAEPELIEPALDVPSPRIVNKNNMYVLDENLKIVGAVEGLAPDERIFSVRFMGDRAYMVTFRQIDPLFVLDLSNPENPRVLGELKIPGFSNYLHPYDENHVIGVGRDASETGSTEGVKLALFDVSNPEEPVEVDKYVMPIYSDSEALYDHKAFLFDREKSLLVLPMRTTDFDVLAEDGFRNGRARIWEGAYVFRLNLDGFELRGEVSHMADPALYEFGSYYYDSVIRRSLFIENVLYTVSGTLVKMNDLATLEEINAVEIAKGNRTVYYTGPTVTVTSG